MATSGAMWSPGFRRPPPGLSKKKALDADVIIAADIGPCNVICKVMDKDTKQHDGSGPEVYLNLKRGDGTRMGINLADFTEDELRAFGTAIIAAIQKAMPLVKQRDKEAEEAAINGEALFPRSYRSSPKITRTPGKKLSEYLESLQD